MSSFYLFFSCLFFCCRIQLFKANVNKPKDSHNLTFIPHLQDYILCPFKEKKLFSFSSIFLKHAFMPIDYNEKAYDNKLYTKKKNN